MIDQSNIDPEVGQVTPASGTSTPIDANADAVQSQSPSQAPTGTQAAQPNQAPVQAQQPQPPTQHHIFRDVLATIGGGSQQPVRDAQGNLVTNASGRVVTRQAGVKSLGASILAGALSSMLAGYAAGAPRRDGNGIVTTNLPAAVQAGAQAGAQNTMNARVQQAQGQSDEQRLRQYTTTKQNYDLLAAATTAHRVGNDEVNHMTEQFAPLHDWLANEGNNSPEIKAAIHGDELSADELHALLTKEDAAHVTRDTAIPAGVRPEIGTDGRPTGRLEQTWMALSNDAKINLTPELAQKYGLEGLAPNTQVPLSVLMKSGINNTVNNSVSSIVQNFGKSVDELKGDGSKSNVTLADLKKTNPALRSPASVSALQMIAGMAPDHAVDALRKAGKPDLAATLVGAYGLTDKLIEKAALQRDAEKKAQEGQVKITSVASDNDADAVLANPTKYPDDVVKAARTWQTNKQNQEVQTASRKAAAEATAKAKVTQSSARNEDGSWNLNSLPVALVEGNLDPSQLSKRSADYNQKLQQANEYSMAKYGRPFDIAQAQADYRYSTNPQTQNVLKLINGMTEPNGAIAIAQNAAKKLPAIDSGLLNKVFNATATQFGSSEATNFHTAMLGLADEYSKVMGGGVASDTGRQQALDILKDSYSKGQLNGAVDIMRQDITARKTALVGNNRYLQKQYGAAQSGQASPQTGSRVVPAGAIAGRDANGNIVGYRTADGKVVRF